MSFEIQRSRAAAVEWGYPVHIGCFGEWDPRTLECCKCQKRISKADIAFPSPSLVHKYAEDVNMLLRRIDELEERLMRYEDRSGE